MARYNTESLIEHQKAINKYKSEMGRELKIILFFVGFLIGLSIGFRC